MSVEGELTLIPQTTETHPDCLVLDHCTPRERNVAGLLASRLGVVPDILGEHRVGRVRITVELLAPPAPLERSTPSPTPLRVGDRRARGLPALITARDDRRRT